MKHNSCPIVQDVLSFVHRVLQERISKGDSVIDATCGQGRDTLHLAQCVGHTGRVWAFDIQQTALDITQGYLKNNIDVVTLICANHAQMADYVHQRVSAVVFNLGYLPTGDKTITTQSQTTIEALQVALSLLEDKGVITVTLYPGHNEGAIEAQSVEVFAQSLPQQEINVLRYQFANRHSTAPYALIFEKR